MIIFDFVNQRCIVVNMEEQYLQILEKTNQQLGLWTNPYGLMVGALAVLFTALTIVAVFIIYRQSREYKEKLQSDMDLYHKSFSDFLVSQKVIIEQRRKEVTQVEDDINKLLKEYEKKLKASSESQKAEIEKAIQKLEEQKLSLSSAIGPITVSPQSVGFVGLTGPTGPSVLSGGLYANDYHQCTKCGFGFMVNNNRFLSASVLLGSQVVTCPRCSNIDRI